jgi:hypothetical protein
MAIFEGPDRNRNIMIVGCLSGYGYLNVKKLPTLP